MRDILIKARNLVAAGWTQQTHATTADGVTPVPSPFVCRAKCFCIDGALLRATADQLGLTDELARATDDDAAIERVSSLVAYHSAYGVLADLCPVGPVDFNDSDSTTRADVLALFDRAIEALPDHV
jgi:hypothetical protein